MDPLTTVATTMFESVTSATFTPILSEVIALVPKLLPAIIGFLAFRKGWAFIGSAIHGA